MKISIVGLGYVGTVSAACLATKGHSVWGVDINSEKVRLIVEGRSPIVEPGLDELLHHARQCRRLQVTWDIEQALQQSEVCIVSVATPSRPNGQTDSSHLLRACEQIALALSKLQKRQVVVIRSSVLPSIFDRCRAVFSSTARDLVDLCTNPEFLREGTAIRDFESPPFTILGTDDAAVESVLRSMYSALPGRVFTMKPKEALMLKYASNAFHALKVAFANEIGALCGEVGVEPAEVMNTFCEDTQLNISRKYLMPGFAFGGSCLPNDVRALLYIGKESDIELPLLKAILQSNEEVIERAYESIHSVGVRRIGFIGLSFKPNTDDLRESPFVELAERLLGKGYELTIYDPNVMITKLVGANREYVNQVIPHLSSVLVSSLDGLSGAELLLVGHYFDGVHAFLKNTSVPSIDLAELNAPPEIIHAKSLAVTTYAV